MFLYLSKEAHVVGEDISSKQCVFVLDEKKFAYNFINSLLYCITEKLYLQGYIDVTVVQ